jgi:hypothetical protein
MSEHDRELLKNIARIRDDIWIMWIAFVVWYNWPTLTSWFFSAVALTTTLIASGVHH